MKEKKIILLLFPPIINKFDFQSDEAWWFLDLAEARRKNFQKKNVTSLGKEEMIRLIDIDYNQEVSELIQKKTNSNLVIVNYPHNEKQFSSLSLELSKENRKINNIVLLNISDYEVIIDLKDKYLICPLCEKIYKKEEVIKESEFVCPVDKDYRFSAKEVSEFNDYIIDYYLKNCQFLIKNFLKENNLSSSAIAQLTINKKEEIFSGEAQKKILKIMENL